MAKIGAADIIVVGLQAGCESAVGIRNYVEKRITKIRMESWYACYCLLVPKHSGRQLWLVVKNYFATLVVSAKMQMQYP